ncbi:MAG: FHA domain-containing protein [Coriobacteriia bacterium]|nr:FHA domain-containing protein [Coriobacteriia bacterium]
MVDIVLLFGKILFLALLYLFLLAAVRSGIGMVRTSGSKKQPKGLGLTVVRGPKEISGITLPLTGPIVVGRSPDADLVIADDFISAIHLRVIPSADGATVEDLGSTNGTLVNGQPATRPLGVSVGDLIEIGTNQLKIVRS